MTVKGDAIWLRPWFIGTIAGFGFVLFLIGLIAPPLILNSAQKALHSSSKIDPESGDKFTDWLDSTESRDSPAYAELYFYNVTNVDAIANGNRIEMKEIGPYVFRLKRIKHTYNVSQDTDEITYFVREWYEFDAERSGSLKSSDVITWPSIAYSQVVSRAAGSENKLKISIFPSGVHTALESFRMALNNLTDTQLYSMWGNADFIPAGVPKPTLVNGSYLLFSEFSKARSETITFNDTQVKELLYDPNIGLLKSSTNVGMFLLSQGARPTYTSVFDDPNTAAKAKGLVQQWIGQWLQGALEAKLKQVWKENKGSQFVSRPIDEFIFGKYTDSLLKMVGRPTNPMICNAGETITNGDPCKEGWMRVKMGLKDIKTVGQYTAYHSSESYPPYTGKACSQWPCLEGEGVWKSPQKVSGYDLGGQPPGSANGYSWNKAVSKDAEIRVWTSLLLRSLPFYYGADGSVADIDTWRFELRDPCGYPDPEYFITQTLVINRTTLSNGIPIFALPNRLSHMDQSMIKPVWTVDVTTLKGCILGQPDCVGDRVSDWVSLQIEPLTGATLEGHERLTTAVLIPKPNDGAFVNMTKGPAAFNGETLIPLFAADRQAKLTPGEKRDNLRKLIRAVGAAPILAGVFISFGVLFIIISVVLFVLFKKQKDTGSRIGVELQDRLIRDQQL